jgi:hypothetical protein
MTAIQDDPVLQIIFWIVTILAAIGFYCVGNFIMQWLKKYIYTKPRM